MYAAFEGRTEIVKMLLDKGADVNAKDKYGQTALKVAASQDHTLVVDLLKQAGAKE
jgi:ankyrin repeat protein